MTVIQFPGKEPETVPEPMLWVCECGCCSFELLSDETAICALCRKPTDSGGWARPETEDLWEGKEPVREVSGNGDPDFAKLVMSRRIMDQNVLLVALVREDGLVSTWTCAEGPAQVEWVLEKLQRVELILKTGK